MMSVRPVIAHFHFPVSNLSLAQDLLGTSFTVCGGERSVIITFPSDQVDFGTSRSLSQPIALFSGGVQDLEGRWLARSVLLLRASVNVELPVIPLDDYEFTQAALRGAADIARTAVHKYLEVVRGEYGQYWLGLGSGMPRTTWITEVVDRDTGENLNLGYHDPVIGMGIVGNFDHTAHRAAIATVERGDPPALPEQLLADAKYVGRVSNPPQRRESLLLAAVACEVAIKQRLRVVCPPPAMNLLEYALDNPREVTQQAAGLFDTGVLAVIGRSLRLENKTLWKGIESLFRQRNRVAHRGEDVDAGVLHQALNDADACFAWVRSLVPISIESG